MARGQESDAHRVMLEAFEICLRKLFPESRVTLGRRVQPIGLKPDIYIEHPDGRKWAYEMIYGNKSSEHTLDNHGLYRNAGIHDYWILWDSLAPSSDPLPTDQGVLEPFVAAKKRTKATKLLQALVKIHSEHTTVGQTALYAFSLDGLNGLIENPHHAMQVISTGITIYQVESVDTQRRYLEYTCDFVTLMELNFNENGCIRINDGSEDGILQGALLKSLGVDEHAKSFPLAYLKNLNQILLNLPSKMPEDVIKVYVERILKDATPEEILELQAFATSDGATKVAALSLPNPQSTSLTASLDNAEGIGAVADFLNKFQIALEQAGFPTLLKKMLLEPLDPKRWADIADVMQWQESSEAVQRTRNNEH